MGTRLEQLQAAAKAKTAAGQPIFSQIATPVAIKPTTPTVGGVTAAVSQPKAAAAPISNTTSSVKSASALSPAIQAEVQRKASAGIALTNPTAATQSAYNAAVKPSVTAPTPSVGALAGISAGITKPTAPSAASAPTAPSAASAPTAAVAQPNTNYVQQGGQTLNNLLYLKKSYESGKTGAASYAGQYYNQLDPNTAAAVKNMNAAQLEQYIAGMGNGNTTSGQAVQQGTPAVATKDYNALAQAQYDRELAALLAGAQSQETELNRRYDYANGVTQDNRQLETATFNRNNAPTAWDGSTGYQAAMMDRNRSIEDHYTGEALKDNVAAAYSQANAFRGQAGNYLTTEANQLQTADQQLAQQEATLTGVYKGQKTAAQANADREYNLSANNQQFNQGAMMAQLTGYLPNGQPTSEQQQLQLKNLWMVAEQTGVIPDSLATLYGLPKGTQTQAAYQFAQNLAINQGQLDISKQNANTSQASAQSGITNNNFNRLMDVWKATGAAPSGLEAYGIASGEQWYQEASQIKENSMTPQQVLTNIRELYQEPVYTKDALGNTIESGTKLTTDPAKRKQMFDNVVDSGLSSKETMQVLSSLQYSKEEITKLYNEGLASGGQ